MKGKDFNVDDLLKEIFQTQTLNGLFEKRIRELDLTPTNALEVIGIEYRALQGILNGTNKRVDATNFIKIANFLKIAKEDFVSLYLDELEKNFPNSHAYPAKKIDFINANFDLAALRKVGFIKSITDYRAIESKINKRLGIKSIFDYNPMDKAAAFSAGAVEPKNLQNRQFWLENVLECFKELANPYEYDRQRLIRYIPQIKKHALDVEGLKTVISELYKLGVSVFYQSSLPALHLRGATLVLNDKPCVVLTDYKGFYPTIWFALLHELSHVLFDLEEIKLDVYHITEDESNGIHEKEKKANDFARGYFLSSDKMQSTRPHLNNKLFIEEFAFENNIHPSFIYVFSAFDAAKDDVKAWPRAQRNNPNFNKLTDLLDLKWADERSNSEHIQYLKDLKIYN